MEAGLTSVLFAIIPLACSTVTGLWKVCSACYKMNKSLTWSGGK